MVFTIGHCRQESLVTCSFLPAATTTSWRKESDRITLTWWSLGRASQNQSLLRELDVGRTMSLTMLTSLLFSELLPKQVTRYST